MIPVLKLKAKLQLVLALATATSIGDAHAGNFMWQPQLYFSEEDSPFIAGIRAGTIYLEDFEDQALNTPFVAEPTGVNYFGTTFRERFPSAPFGSVWSVDGDDGFVDGNTFLGDTWITTNSSGFTRANFAQFDFLENEAGALPTFVGIVVTQAKDVESDVEVIVRDIDGNNYFSDVEFDPRSWSPPGGTGPGSPLIQRFIGFRADEGIASLGLFNASQVDHLQYGYAIPEPGTVGLLSVAALGLLLFRRRR